MCGIIGYFTDPKYGIFVAAGINTALTMLQHRGQGLFWIGKSWIDACGITTCDGKKITTVKDNGLVSE